MNRLVIYERWSDTSLASCQAESPLTGGIELQAVYLMKPAQLEPYFTKWETKWHADGCKDINNPKIPRAFVKEHGQQIFTVAERPIDAVPVSPELKPKDVEQPEG
jgi:hypothetical protein